MGGIFRFWGGIRFTPVVTFFFFFFLFFRFFFSFPLFSPLFFLGAVVGDVYKISLSSASALLCFALFCSYLVWSGVIC